MPAALDLHHIIPSSAILSVLAASSVRPNSMFARVVVVVVVVAYAAVLVSDDEASLPTTQ